MPPDIPRRPLARALARTLSELRREGVDPAHLDAAVAHAGAAGTGTFAAVAGLFRRFHAAVDGRFADPAALAAAAAGEVARARWLDDAPVLIVGDLEPSELPMSPEVELSIIPFGSRPHTSASGRAGDATESDLTPSSEAMPDLKLRGASSHVLGERPVSVTTRSKSLKQTGLARCSSTLMSLESRRSPSQA